MLKYIYSSYLINFVQLLSMGAFSLVIPYVIGFSEYGKYVVLFAIPGLIHGFVESGFITYMLKTEDSLKKRNESSLGLLIFYLIIFNPLTFLLLLLTNDYVFSILACLLLTILLIRSYFLGKVCALNGIDKYKKSLIFSDFLMLLFILIIYFIFDDYLYHFMVSHGHLYHFIVSHGRLYPFMVLLCTNIFFILYLNNLLKGKYKPKLYKSLKYISISDIKKHVKYGYYRVYEDGLFTLMPFLIFLGFGESLAGKYRYIISITKLSIKAFPIRADILQFANNNNMISHSFITWLSFSYLFIGVPLMILFSLVEYNYATNLDEFKYILLSSGAVAVTAILMPVLNHMGKTNITMITSTILLFSCALSLFISIKAFINVFVLSNFLSAFLLIIFFHVVTKNENNK